MALFEIGAWESPADTEALNKKLFGSVEHKASVPKKKILPRQDVRPDVKSVSLKKKKKVKAETRQSTKENGVNAKSTAKYAQDQTHQVHPVKKMDEQSKGQKTHSRNKYRHLAKSPRPYSGHRQLMDAVKAMVQDKSDEGEDGKLLTLKPNSIMENGSKVGDVKIKGKRKHDVLATQHVGVPLEQSTESHENSQSVPKKKKPTGGKKIDRDITSPKSSSLLVDRQTSPTRKKKRKSEINTVCDKDTDSPKATQIRKELGSQGNENTEMSAQDKQKRKKKKKNNPKKNKYRHLVEQKLSSDVHVGKDLDKLSQSPHSPRTDCSQVVNAVCTSSSAPTRKKKKLPKAVGEFALSGDEMKSSRCTKKMKKKHQSSGTEIVKNDGDLSVSASSLEDTHNTAKSTQKASGAKLKKQKLTVHMNSPGNSLHFSANRLKQIFGQTASPQHIETEFTHKSEKHGSDKSASEEREVVNVSADGAESQKKGKRDEMKSMTLAQRMREQLNQARFRYLNEQLYTTSGGQAFSMMQEDPEAFHVYHAGYSSQVEKWPLNPVDTMIDYVKKRSPETVVADFGCGDAKLAQGVKSKVHSFDLVALNDHVTACDMAHVPLPNSSVDIAVFCLSLMGTNMGDYICEANRVLRNSGKLLVAEVVSRFEKVGSFIKKMEKMGFTLLQKDDSNKMFVWLEFKKTGAPKKEALPHLELAPCVYKKR